ncbi:hypothetical protein MMC34_000313 [Xylographa carneopallida]|nr:hypothetical protein [Xylographa carneopallida]
MHNRTVSALRLKYPDTWQDWGTYFRNPIFLLALLPFLDSVRPIWDIAFVPLFAFKFVKLVVHLCSLRLYWPIPRADNPTITAIHVTVILSTTGDLGLKFKNCLRSILANNPARIIVITTPRRYKLARSHYTKLPSIIEIHAVAETKRESIIRAIQRAPSEIIVLANDDVFWGRHFLASALAPFEDHRIGGAATAKRVVRHYPFKDIWSNFCNFIACTFIERQNFEFTATNCIDGGFGVISTGTGLYRADILRSFEFTKEYPEETWLLGLVGPIESGQDLFITRYLVKDGWKIHYQNSKEATVYTTLGDPEVIFGLLIKTARLTWHSNLTSLFRDLAVWHSQP